MVVKLFDHQWISKSGVDEYEILENLPKKLRAQIAFSANRHLLENNFLFRGQPLSYQIELILHMKTQTLLPEEYIYIEGHVGNDMYIIREGLVQLIKKNTETGCDEYIELNKGNFFGQASVINFDYIGRRREETAKSKGFCSIWVLEKRILLEVLLDYPIVMDYLRNEFYQSYFHPQIDKSRIISNGLYNLEEIYHQIDTIDQYRKEILFHFHNIQEEQIFIDYVIGNVETE
ncbi:Cyclic nucleotide-gated olfactory channel [Oopsacas minuta]|uniref:Cyclic nucleotide-gated olfactory channel n=1 Tax=Oopsacas minuta TaxID=111878 RepID=A0AAV7JPM8_9METZ|nr:Cyclic nucleotide-gated olfactory channel [Oopsacas minuta]